KGTWYRGEKVFDPSDQHFVANIAEAYTGWTKWIDKKPADQRFVRCLDYRQRAHREALGDLDKNAWETGIPQDPWQPSDRIVLRTMDSAEDLLTFISGSVGGRNALAKLLGRVAKSDQARKGKFPVVVLESGTYDHADYGVVHYPIFRIVDWAWWDREMEVIP